MTVAVFPKPAEAGSMPGGSRVFVVQDNGKLDFSDAERYGRLVPILERDIFPDDEMIHRVGTTLRLMRSKLRDFNPSRDYVLLTGDPVAIFLAAVVLGEQGITWYRCLKWDREERTYYQVDIAA